MDGQRPEDGRYGCAGSCARSRSPRPAATPARGESRSEADRTASGSACERSTSASSSSRVSALPAAREGRDIGIGLQREQIVDVVGCGAAESERARSHVSWRVATRLADRTRVVGGACIAGETLVCMHTPRPVTFASPICRCRLTLLIARRILRDFRKLDRQGAADLRRINAWIVDRLACGRFEGTCPRPEGLRYPAPTETAFGSRRFGSQKLTRIASRRVSSLLPLLGSSWTCIDDSAWEVIVGLLSRREWQLGLSIRRRREHRRPTSISSPWHEERYDEPSRIPVLRVRCRQHFPMTADGMVNVTLRRRPLPRLPLRGLRRGSLEPDPASQRAGTAQYVADLNGLSCGDGIACGDISVDSGHIAMRTRSATGTCTYTRPAAKHVATYRRPMPFPMEIRWPAPSVAVFERIASSS